MGDDGRGGERRACGAGRCGEVECVKYVRMATSVLKEASGGCGVCAGPYGVYSGTGFT